MSHIHKRLHCHTPSTTIRTKLTARYLLELCPVTLYHQPAACYIVRYYSCVRIMKAIRNALKTSVENAEGMRPLERRKHGRKVG
jgi:hypothetical protein